ncbi:MFS transporter [Chloroflexia bacterium SDU3-3]|nr:MFS transporter [Chloroflexia bacterium SDU3-3]
MSASGQGIQALARTACPRIAPRMKPMTTGTRLWNRNFLLLWLGLVQSYLGDAFSVVGLTWLLSRSSDGAGAVATALALQSLPRLLGPLAGVVVDRVSKKALMIGCDLARGAILLAMGGLEAAHMLSLGHIYVFSVLLAVLALGYSPSLRILLPSVVPNEALPTANSAIQFGMQAALIVGSSLAGLALTFTDVAAALLVDGGSFILCALMLGLVQFPARLTASKALGAGQIWQDLAEGFRYIAARRLILALTALACCLNFLLGPVNIVFPIYADLLGSGVQGFGVLTSALGVGLLLGSLAAGVIGDRLTPLQAFAVGLSGMALALLGLGYAPTIALSLAMAALLGSMVPIIQVPLVSQLQRNVAPEFQGRVFATLETLATLSIPISALLIGQSLRVIPVRWVFVGGAAGVAALVLVCLLALRRQPAPEVQPSAT